jgi:nitroreductase/NAD-dependent dihydropyrimidine dehydrogenase PreA subunit
MPEFLVDATKCTRDGICLTECPAHFIELRAESPVPTWIPRADERCVSCGHCVAVCPQGAISLSTMPVDQCPDIRHDLAVSVPQVSEHLRARRSIRSYHDRPVERETLAALIYIARFAPSGGNSQPVQWLVAYDADLVRRLGQHTADWMRSALAEPGEHWWGLHRVMECWDAGEDIAFRCTAPHVIFAHAPKGVGPVACTIALTYVEVAAPAYGLGTCRAGFLTNAANDWPPMRQELGVPEGHTCFGALMIGYPRHEMRRIPLRNQARLAWL